MEEKCKDHIQTYDKEKVKGDMPFKDILTKLTLFYQYPLFRRMICWILTLIKTQQ